MRKVTINNRTQRYLYLWLSNYLVKCKGNSNKWQTAVNNFSILKSDPRSASCFSTCCENICWIFFLFFFLTLLFIFEYDYEHTQCLHVQISSITLFSIYTNIYCILLEVRSRFRITSRFTHRGLYIVYFLNLWQISGYRHYL